MTRPHSVFLSYTWSDVPEVDRIDAALRRRGIGVFRDTDTPTFDRITDSLAAALDSSSVLLCFYSARYPTRYACQWELTRAFLAASRLGNPCDRILVVNPEADESHIAPAALTDAGFLSWGPDQDVTRLADRVAAKVAATGGVPLGTADGYDDLSRLGHRPARPRSFVGRYPQLWAVHSALHPAGRWAVEPPRPHAVAVLRAPSGMGKTSLAEQYSFLFRGAHPGGVLWLSLAADGRAMTAETMMSEYARLLRAEAGHRLGIELADLLPDPMRTVLGERLTAEGRDVLVVVDDVPAGLEPADLDRLVLPSMRVRTLITAREISASWPVEIVDLGGLTAVEAEELFRPGSAELDAADRAAVAGLVTGYGGHPSLLALAAAQLRSAHGTGAAGRYAARPNGRVESVIGDIGTRVLACDRPARLTLGLAAVLAAAPFDSGLVVAGLSPELGDSAATEVATALSVLGDSGLLRRVDDDTGSRRPPRWQLHALVADAVGRELDADLLARLAIAAAAAIADRLATDPDAHLLRHARAIAGNRAVPVARRLALLRDVAAVHEDHGDAPAARDTVDDLIATAPDGLLTDLLTAARLALAAGDAEPALGYATRVIELARADGDDRAGYRARLLAANAHDLRGRLHLADQVFHAHPTVVVHGVGPSWMPQDEAHRLRVARAAALRIRGRHREALAEITAVYPQVRREHPGGVHRGPWPSAAVELARLRLFNGQTKDARQIAGDVWSLFQDAGLPRHRLARQALAVRAEANLAIAFTDLNLTSDHWRRAELRIGVLAEESAQWFGRDNQLTLDLVVLHAQALLDSGRPDECLRVLAGADRHIEDTMGAEHPLRLRALSVTGSGRFALGDYAHAAEILDDVLARQVGVLGDGHPDTNATRLELGKAFAGIGRGEEASALVAQAWRHECASGWWRERALKAMVSQSLVKLPKPLFDLAMIMDRSAKRNRRGGRES